MGMTRWAPPLALGVAFCTGCLHTWVPDGEPQNLLRVPLLVSPDVLVDRPSAFAQAQILRDALVEVLREEGFCLDDRGDFEAMLQLSADIEPSEGEDRAVTLTLDKATGVRIDEWQEPVGDLGLPASKSEARELVGLLVRKLEDSSAAWDLADSAEGCHACCAPE